MRFNKKEYWVFGFLGVLFGNVPLMAQEIKPTPLLQKPIVCKWTTLGGMRYFFAGKRIEGKDLEQTIFSLKDMEATKLLKQSEDCETLGWFGIGIGVPLMVAGVVGLANTATNNPNVVNPLWASTGLGGAVIGVAGSFLLIQGRTSQFAAVQRYNAVIHDEGDMSFNPRPKTSVPLLTLSAKF